MQRHMAVIIHMGDPKESESKIDSSFETNIIENFYYGNNYTQGDDEYTDFEPYVLLLFIGQAAGGISGYYKNTKI